MFFYTSITVVSLVLLLFAIIIGGFYYSSFNNEQRCFYYYLIFIGGIELITKLLTSFGLENLFLFPVYVIGEYLLLITMLFTALKLSKHWLYFLLLLPVYIISEAIFFWFNLNSFEVGIGKTISHFIIILLIGFYLLKSLKSVNTKKKNKFLPIYASLFFYYSISITLFSLLNQLPHISIENASLIWGLNNVFSSILYGISTYTFLQLKK
jgi:hypothetical protein